VSSCAQPFGKLTFRDSSCCKILHHDHTISRLRPEAVSVQTQKCDAHNESSALVSIHKCMGFRDAKSIGCGKIKKIYLTPLLLVAAPKTGCCHCTGACHGCIPGNKQPDFRGILPIERAIDRRIGEAGDGRVGAT